MSKYIELTVQIDEKIKKNISSRIAFSYTKTNNINNTVVTIQIEKSNIDAMYNLCIDIKNVINGDENNYSQDFNSFKDICHFFKVSSIDNEIIYLINIEVNYISDIAEKYLYLFTDVTIGYVDKKRMFDYIKYSNFKRAKSLFKICHLIICYNYYYTKEEVEFIINKFSYHGFEETIIPYSKKTNFKSYEDLLETFINNTIKLIKADTSIVYDTARENWLTKVYCNDKNKLFLAKIMVE